MKKKDFIFGLVGLILILGVVIGLVVWFNRPGDSATPDDTTKPSGNVGIIEDSDKDNESDSLQSDIESDSQSDTNKNNSELSNDYQIGDVGFVTRDNITTFYVEVSAAYFPITSSYCSNTWSVNLLDNEITPVTSYPLAYKFSIDGGDTWHNMQKQQDTDMYICANSQGDRTYVSLDSKILVAYTQIENCADPMLILDQLNNTVFDSKDIIDGCCGSYTYYTKFDLYMFHKSK